MKLKEYAVAIATLAKKHPDVDVVYSTDDEGNDFKQVTYAPTVGHITSEDVFHVTSDPDFEGPINACCVN